MGKALTDNLRRALQCRRASSSSVSNTSSIDGITAPTDAPSLIKRIDAQVAENGFSMSSWIFSQFRSSIKNHMCNMAMKSYNHMSKHVYTLFVFAQMRKNRIFPNPTTYATVLKSAAELRAVRFGRSVHCCAAKSLMSGFVGTSLVRYYCMSGSVEDAEKMFDEMSDRDVVTWNALISGLTRCGKVQRAVEVLRGMVEEGVEPGEGALVTMLSACARMDVGLDEGRWIHDYVVKKKLDMSVVLGTALMDMYLKNAAVDKAEEVFNLLTTRNAYCWNVLIRGYAMHGRAEDALRMFFKMVAEECKPDEVTFLGVLSACTRLGLTDEGRYFFRMMIVDFGLSPKIEHYTSMVHLLGRAGLLDEAQNMIRMISVKSDPGIWRAFLGACRFHKNAPKMELALKNLIDLEPGKAEHYINLADTFSRTGKKAEAAQVEALMKFRGIKNAISRSSNRS